MRTQEAFNISILDCAKRLGLRFHRTWINREGLTEYVFHCPLRPDKNASIYINEVKNVWYDNGGIINGGAIIQFVNYLHGTPFNDTRSALKILDKIYPELLNSEKPTINNYFHSSTPLSSIPSTKKTNSPTFEVLEVKELFSYPLKNYLQVDRKINIDIAKLYVKEVVYKHIQKNISFYGIGFKSGETWAIRRKGFKGFLGKGTDITIFDTLNPHLRLFEGFIDFLSYLTQEKITKSPDTVIVLNSATKINKAIKYIQSKNHIRRICFYKHQDEAGIKIFQTLEKNLKNTIIHDMSKNYSNHNDLNEKLIYEHLNS